LMCHASKAMSTHLTYILLPTRFIILALVKYFYKGWKCYCFLFSKKECKDGGLCFPRTHVTSKSLYQYLNSDLLHICP
jgi:hypothetical protein